MAPVGRRQRRGGAVVLLQAAAELYERSVCLGRQVVSVTSVRASARGTCGLSRVDITVYHLPNNYWGINVY